MNEEYKIKVWVARDQDGCLFIGKEKPIGNVNLSWIVAEEYFPFDTELFPELTWENSPIEVELTIKKY